jgi:hypothetical protein
MAKNGRVTKRARWNYEQQSVLSFMREGETYATAKARLDQAWKEGTHPAQVQKQAPSRMDD